MTQATVVEQRAPARRTRSGRLLREVGHHLHVADAMLADHPSAESVEAARASLAHAREAISLLMRERAEGPASRAMPADAPRLVRRRLLDPRPTSPREARSFTRAVCADWSLPAHVTSGAADVVGELVANGVRGAAEPLVLALELGPDDLLVKVWDDAPGVPTPIPYRSGLTERGIGLRLVKRLSEAWGTTQEQNGKWVWARLPVPPQAAPPS